VIAWRGRRLSADDIRLLACVCLVQLALGIALRVIRVPVLRRAVRRAGVCAPLAGRAPEHRVAWAIEAVGRRLPGISTCFVRALAAEMLFSGGGAIRIGVKRTAAGALESHAWFERDGRALVGGAGASEFVPFTTLSGTTPRQV
jgi:hypothetical protein